jgi:hypothetical protein
MRVELFDSEGNRYTVAFEGHITREKALHLLDLVELLGGPQPEGGNVGTNPDEARGELSKYGKVRLVAQKHFPLVWFSSREVQAIYEQEFREPLSLSTAATYLARMANRGHLLKTGASNRLRYKLAPNLPQATLKQQMP